MKQLVFTVTNDLSFDQRMIRICSSLAAEGYRVTLVGIKTSRSLPLVNQPFRQKRLPVLFRKGKAFYAEYNLRLFLYLLFKKAQAICAIDLDTILPVYFITRLKRIPAIYDAHELFCEMKEVVSRPRIYKTWKRIERYAVPHFKWGYTVNQPIAAEFRNMYNVSYEVIRNMTVLQPLTIPEKREKYILYQGAVNEGRCFETLIPAMKEVDAPLIICGDGNFMQQAQQLVREHGLEKKIIFKGKITPAALTKITREAWVGITLFENNGLSNYYSLGNRFFDYMHHAVPQLCVNYPAYNELNNSWSVAVLIDDTSPGTIARGLNTLLHDQSLYHTLQQNCLKAREVLNWQEESKKLAAFYKKLFQ